METKKSPEVISMTERDDVQHFFICSTVLQEKLSGHKDTIPKLIDAKKDFNDSFQVEFKVNGIDLPFAETVDELFSRFRSYVDEEAKKKAIEIVSAAGFDDLVETIKSAKWEIIQKFKEKGIDLTPDENN